ncbi:MAG: hypothetical protein Q7T55_17555, partial [Solirubrobacteraceae bacterium]|nr:hypothetical protein [Solirubrobacteraceae bacterium]
MASDLDHDRIREVEDRSATAALLELALGAGAPEEERTEAFKTLRQLHDHRAIAPLIAALEDRSLDDDVRRAAAKVLDDIDDATSLSQRARWWNDGDRVLREYVLGRMGRAEAELVVAVASDGEDPLQSWGVEAMSFDFDEAPNARVF